MQFRSKLLKRRAAAAGATIKKIYDVYMTPDGYFAAGEEEDAGNNVQASKRGKPPRPGETIPPAQKVVL